MRNDQWFIPSLWPGGSEEIWSPWGRRHGERFVAIPSRADAQQLVPWRWSSAIAASQRVSDDRSRYSRIRDAGGVAALLGVAVASSSHRLGVRADISIVDHLSSELGLPGSTFGTFMFGPARANRKPVIQLHDRRGRTQAWVKVGTNDLTRTLLGREIDVLEDFARRTLTFRVPAVMGRGTFGTSEWAALEPMTVEHRVAPDLDTFDNLAMSIEETAPRWSGPSEDSPLVDRLRVEATGLEFASSAVERLVARHRLIELAGAHGDLVPWNMLSGDADHAVWDWERYEATAPVGFDRIHRRVQVAVQQLGRTLEAAVADVETDLDSKHEPATTSWSALVDWYLAVMLCRYQRDAQRHANPRLVGRINDLARVLADRGARS